MPKHSAGILGMRRRSGGVELFLVHPGGPLYASRDAGVWSIPKGLVEAGESALEAARRELREETGFAAPPGPYVALGSVRLKSGKRIDAWAVAAAFDPSALRSEPFTMVWPPRSGERRSYPEVDRAAWLGPMAARDKLHAAQRPFIERALASLDRVFRPT